MPVLCTFRKQEILQKPVPIMRHYGNMRLVLCVSYRLLEMFSFTRVAWCWLPFQYFLWRFFFINYHKSLPRYKPCFPILNKHITNRCASYLVAFAPFYLRSFRPRAVLILCDTPNRV